MSLAYDAVACIYLPAARCVGPVGHSRSLKTQQMTTALGSYRAADSSYFIFLLGNTPVRFDSLSWLLLLADHGLKLYGFLFFFCWGFTLIGGLYASSEIFREFLYTSWNRISFATATRSGISFRFIKNKLLENCRVDLSIYFCYAISCARANLVNGEEFMIHKNGKYFSKTLFCRRAGLEPLLYQISNTVTCLSNDRMSNERLRFSPICIKFQTA